MIGTIYFPTTSSSHLSPQWEVAVEQGQGTDHAASQCPLVSYHMSEEQRTEPGNRRIVVLLTNNLYLQLEGKMGQEVKFLEKIPQSQGFQMLQGIRIT